MAHEEPDLSTRRTGVVHGRGPRERLRVTDRGTSARDWVAIVVLAVLALGAGAWFLSTSPATSPTAARPSSSAAAVVAGGATASPVASSSSHLSGSSSPRASSGAASAGSSGATEGATDQPTDEPTDGATDQPTDEPSIVLPKTPNLDPTDEPTPPAPALVATQQPSDQPADAPTDQPTDEASPGNELSPPSEPAPSDQPDSSEPPTLSPAAFTVDSIDDGESVNDPSLDISGAAPAGSIVTRDVPQWFDDHVQAQPTGRWTMHVQLAAGDNELRFRLGDDRSTEIVLHIGFVPSP